MACEAFQFYWRSNFGTYAAYVRALSHGAIFLAACNAILLFGDVKLANACTSSQFTGIYF